MNFIFVSPNFPIRYFKWVEALKERGIRVLGIGDTPYDGLHPRLKRAITEYYYTPDLSNYEAVLEAGRFFKNKYGPIDYVESDNEWWLYTDSKLREDLDVPNGFRPAQMRAIKAKSAMKKSFEEAGVKTMRYILVDGPKDLERALEFAKKVDYPLFVKPDVGVGAASSYKLKDEAALRKFLSEDLPETYIMEEYIEGTIISFDGICNSHSDVVFATSDHFETPVAEIVNGEDADYVYYNNPFDLPFHDGLDGQSFLAAGKRVVKAFGIQKRFFHIEFFHLSKDKPGFARKGDFVALECNMRPAGGNTPDLIDYANSVSCYEIYADVIAYDENRQKMDYPKYYAFASARRNHVEYLHSIEEVRERYHDHICMEGSYPPSYAQAMGDTFVYAKFSSFEDGVTFDTFVRARKN